MPLLLLALLLAPATEESAFAGGKHVHGEGRLDIAIEATPGPADATKREAVAGASYGITLRYELPGDSLFGFEHEAKTDKERQIVSDMMAQVRSGAQNWLSIPSELGCSGWTVQASDPKPPQDAGTDSQKSKKNKKPNVHSEITVTVSGSCTKDPLGSKIAFEGFKSLKRLHALDIQIVGANTQIGLRLQRKAPGFTLGQPTSAKP